MWRIYTLEYGKYLHDNASHVELPFVVSEQRLGRVAQFLLRMVDNWPHLSNHNNNYTPVTNNVHT